MGDIIEIYHTKITLPDRPDDSEIEDWGMPKEEQYWRRKPLPAMFKNILRDEDGNIELTPEQEAYCNVELLRIRNGFWFFLNGEATYITGRNYYYLQYWTLENRKHPEYRDTSRRYYLYLEHWYNIYWCLGVIRGKGRRSGASSESSSNATGHVTTTKNARVGHVSKTSADARKMFIYRMQFGFRHLPFFLQPTLANDKDSKSELVFNVPLAKTKKAKKAQLIDEVEGLNSILDYQPTATNSYDSERLSWAFIDEGGKFPADVPFSQFVSIILETLVEGAERTGFGEFPSTVNELTKKGGAEFKKVWDDADWKKDFNVEEDPDEEIDTDNEATANRLVRYYCAAYDGLAGFIGKYGESIIEPPTEDQAKFLLAKYGEKKYNGQLKYGAKAYLEKRREKLSGAALEEEIRKYSFNEAEMFMSANTECVFNTRNIMMREGYLKDHPVYKRKVIFFRDEETQKVRWRDITENEKSFHWKITQFPKEGEDNKFKFEDKNKKPNRIRDGAIAVDSYSNSQGGRKYGSKASAWIGRRFDIMDAGNTGKAIGHLYGRPSTKEILHNQVMLAAEFYGYLVWYEHSADDYFSYFRDRGRSGYLGSYPLSLMDHKNRDSAERHKGTPITPFSLTKQLDAGISYFENHIDMIDYPELLENAKIFDPYDRTKYDTVVSFLILISVLMEIPVTPPPTKSPLISIFRTQALASPN